MLELLLMLFGLMFSNGNTNANTNNTNQVTVEQGQSAANNAAGDGENFNPDDTNGQSQPIPPKK